MRKQIVLFCWTEFDASKNACKIEGRRLFLDMLNGTDQGCEADLETAELVSVVYTGIRICFDLLEKQCQAKRFDSRKTNPCD